MGKRWNKASNQCELLVQDSGWPTTLENKVVKRDKVKSQKLWLPASKLIEHTYRYTTIGPVEKKK